MTMEAGPEKGPEEEHVLSALQAFQPTPDERFYRRMAGAPWNAARGAGRPYPGRQWRRLALAVPLLILIAIVVLGILSPPGLRATATRVADFFIRSDTDRTTVEVTLVGPGQLDYDFNLTLAEAATAAGFPVLAPQALPEGLSFHGARHDADLDAVLLDYRTADSSQILRITQQRISNNETYASIGPITEVEPVQIGAVMGEYVAGGWKLPALATPLEAAAPGVKVTLEAAWETEGQIQILRWQYGNVLLEILSVTAPSSKGPSLTKADLVALAEGME